MPLEEPVQPPQHQPGWGAANNWGQAYTDPAMGYRGQQGLGGPGSAVSPRPEGGVPLMNWYRANWDTLTPGTYEYNVYAPPDVQAQIQRGFELQNQREQAQRQSELASSFNAIYGAEQSLFGPELTALQGKGSNLMARLPLMNAGYADQQAAMRAKYAADLAQVGNQKAGNDLLLQALGRQPDFINKLRGLDLQSLNLTSDRDIRNTNSQYTSRGSMFTPGYGRDINDIQSGRWIGTQQINTRADEELAKVGDRRKELENQARSYGIQEDQLRAALDQGLAQLNLDQVMSVGQLMDMIGSNNQDQATLGRQILEGALGIWNQGLATGVMPQFPGMGNTGVARPTSPLTGPQ